MTRAALLAAFALSAAMIVFGQNTAIALGDKVEAGSCAISNSGSVSNSSVTCYNNNFGLTDEQLKHLTEAAVKGATEPLTHQIIDISKKLGVTEDAARKLLRIVGEDQNIPEDKLAEALSQAAADYQRARAQLAALNPNNPQARELVEQAKPEIEAGRFDRALVLLQQATQAQFAGAQQAYQVERQARAAGDTQMLGAANAIAAAGNVAMTERRYVVAAQLFDQAANYVPNGHASEQGEYLRREADALFQQGDERGDNGALQSSIEVYGRTLANYPRSQVPLDWAKAQMGLGNALGSLGERECGTARLEEAVKAYHPALDELAREQVPLAWAATQHNLGKALMWLGERDSGGTAQLLEAVQAFDAALTVRTKQSDPLDWALTQVFLGNALQALGERESGTARLQEAVVAYRAALEEFTPQRLPLRWARTQNGLCYVLAKWGEREKNTTRLEKAVATCRAALEKRHREDDPLGWAATTDSLGYALRALGELEGGTALLAEAVQTFDAAMTEYRRERVPLSWANETGNQGVAMMLIADRTNDSTVAERAVDQIKKAYEAEQACGHEWWAGYYQAQLAKAQAIRGRLKGE
jgi:tetratricopeptide (TPR) repeat protein